MKKILITGHKGDVGSVLYKMYKDNGYDIKPLNLKKSSKADRIIHLASKSLPSNSNDIIDSNIIYLNKIINYALKNNIKEIIFFSAISVYGFMDKENIDEKDPFYSPYIYGLTKLIGEQLLRESNINSLCIRFPAILGYRNQTNLMSRFYNSLKKNEEVIVTNHDKVFNNFISIENIFEFIEKLEKLNKFEIINLASKKEITLISLIKLMKETLNSSSKISISKKYRNFFNISTMKAEKNYGFMPYKTKEVLLNWIAQREKYE